MQLIYAVRIPLNQYLPNYIRYELCRHYPFTPRERTTTCNFLNLPTRVFFSQPPRHAKSQVSLICA